MLALWRTSRLCGGPRSHGSCSAQPGPARPRPAPLGRRLCQWASEQPRPGPARPRWVAGCANRRTNRPKSMLGSTSSVEWCNFTTDRSSNRPPGPLGDGSFASWHTGRSTTGWRRTAERPGGGGPRHARVEADRGTPGAPVRRPPPRPPRRPPARCDARRGPATTAPTFAASGCACYHPPVIDGRHHVNVVFGGTSAASAG
jgi:hypothetical protein